VANNVDKINDLKQKLKSIYTRNGLPDEAEYKKLVVKVNSVIEKESDNYRPHNSEGFPGGLIRLKKNIPTIIVPDLHARIEFLLSVLLFKPFDDKTVLEMLFSGEIQVVCVGDGFHAESRAIKRWKKAFEEYQTGFKSHKNMDQEMSESLGLMEIVMEMKSQTPEYFHFLKGNHENVANEKKDGNFPFRKFCYEGEMVAHYMKNNYKDVFQDYYNFEKSLPLFAIGKNFLVSHAEPERFLDEDDIINSKLNGEVVFSLTWTQNDASEPGTVKKMLEHYLDDVPNSYYFGGHRIIRENYFLRAENKYVQIHNPNKFIIAFIKTDRDINLDEDVIDIENEIQK
jgi:hypothetical protein